MKKVTSLVMTALLISTLSACTNRNTAMRNDYNRVTHPGTTQGTRTGYETTNPGRTQGTYRDGVYSATGDKGPNGNQIATVTIYGGRITDVSLRSVDAQGKEFGTNVATPGTTIGRITGNTGTTTADTPGTRNAGTPGATTGGMAGGMAGDITGTPRGNTNFASGDYSFQGYGGNTGPMPGSMPNGVTGTTNTGTATGMTGSGNSGTMNGSTGGTTTNFGSYDQMRREIASAVITNQTYDVNLGRNNTDIGQNWKLAIRRALEKAR